MIQPEQPARKSEKSLSVGVLGSWVRIMMGIFFGYVSTRYVWRAGAGAYVSQTRGNLGKPRYVQTFDIPLLYERA